MFRKIIARIVFHPGKDNCCLAVLTVRNSGRVLMSIQSSPVPTREGFIQMTNMPECVKELRKWGNDNGYQVQKDCIMHNDAVTN